MKLTVGNKEWRNTSITPIRLHVVDRYNFYTITLRNFVVPTLSMVGDPLSGKGCGSPNHIILIIVFSLMFYLLSLFLI